MIARREHPQELEADGVTAWRVGGGEGGERWMRLRKGGRPFGLPPGWWAMRCAWGEPDLSAAPRYLRQLWQSAEGAPGWGWTVREVREQGRPVGWHLVIARPDGGEEFAFSWVERHGAMRLVAQTTTVREAAGLLAGG